VPRAGGGLRQAWRQQAEGHQLLAAHNRVAALSQQLTQVHLALREQLSLLRNEVTEGPGSAAAGDDAIAADLLGHCLSLCTAIHTHHSGEDDQLLPALRAAAPELAPVIDKLIEDHALVAGILRRIRELLTPGPAPSSPGALTRELDGLGAILESHFSYEERRLARAVDTLGPSAWTADVFTTGQAAGELA
jgi:Hemerythrin HHE cation binding domain